MSGKMIAALGAWAAAAVLLGAPGAALAADAAVPADAAGAMKEWAGQPWLEPLAACTALWTVAARNATAPDEQGRFSSQAVAFRMSAATRLEADRAIAYDRALSLVQHRARTYEFLERSSTPDQVLARARACDAVLAAYRAAYP